MQWRNLNQFQILRNIMYHLIIEVLISYTFLTYFVHILCVVHRHHIAFDAAEIRAEYNFNILRRRSIIIHQKNVKKIKWHFLRVIITKQFWATCEKEN